MRVDDTPTKKRPSKRASCVGERAVAACRDRGAWRALCAVLRARRLAVFGHRMPIAVRERPMARTPAAAPTDVPHNAALADRCTRATDDHPNGACRVDSSLSRISVIVLALLAAAIGAHAQALQRLVFATDWLAQAEHGGFYQAVAEGTYRQVRPRRADPHGRPAGQRAAVAGGRTARRRDGRRAAGNVRNRAGRAGRRDRRDVPEESYGVDRASGRESPGGPEGQADRDRRRQRTRRSGRGCDRNTASPTARSVRTGFPCSRSSPIRKLSQQGFATSEPFSIEKGGVRPVGVPAGRLRLSAVFRGARRHAHDARRPQRMRSSASSARRPKAGRATSRIPRRATR